MRIFGALLIFATILAQTIAPAFAASTSVIKGKLHLAPELKSKIEPTAVLYIIARPGAEPGTQTRTMPLAVKRVVQPFNFPMEFTLSQADAMMPNTTLEGKITVSARIAQSGSAIPVKPGDIEVTDPMTLNLSQKSSLKNVTMELKKVH